VTETAALAHFLIDEGMIFSAVAARLDVDARYLRRLLKGEASTESVLGNPCVDAGESATNLHTRTGESSRGQLPAPASGFRSFRELDAWLEREEWGRRLA